MFYSELQRQHREWIAMEFPDQTPEVPAAGLVEEAGELLHCLLKMYQRDLWGDDPRYGRLRNDLVDAVGDCIIYVVSFCNAYGWDFAELMLSVETGYEVHQPLQLGRFAVAEAALCSTPPYSFTQFARYLSLLNRVCEVNSLSFDGCLEVTWEKVRMRRRSQLVRPTVVTLCGSTRFKQAFVDSNFRETMKGRIVLSVVCFEAQESEKLALDELHKRKIDISHEVLVLDCLRWQCDCCDKWFDSRNAEGWSPCCDGFSVQRPYIGDSTRSEIEYAVAHGKKVRYLSCE
jgi:NTP pyrophosphatase (non-canonical NTP hydrolase)